MTGQIRVDLTEQNGNVTTAVLNRGTTPILGSFGVKSCLECLRFGNGYLATRMGDLYFASIRVYFPQPVHIVPRKWVRQLAPNVVVIGGTDGGDLFPAQRSFRLRYSYTADPLDKLLQTSRIQIGQTFIPLPVALKGKYPKAWTWRTSLETGIVQMVPGGGGYDGGEMQTNALGPWMPLGSSPPGIGTFEGIDPYQGCEQDSATTLLRHDLHMERFRECLDPTTGDPAPNPSIDAKGYSLARGDFVNATLPAFWMKLNSDPNDLRAIARPLNTGQCAYAAALRAYQPHDGQHAIRAFGPALAAWRLYGDECAGFDLQVMAAELRYGNWKKPPEANPRQGSTIYGRREASWISFLWSELHQRNGIIEPTSVAIMENGGCMRVPHDPPPSFNPDPWVDGPPGSILQHKLPITEHVEQSQERLAATVHALVSAGHLREAVRLCSREFLESDSLSHRLRHVPRFFAVGNAAGPYAKIVDGAYSDDGSDADFAPLLAFGTMCWVDPTNRERWLNAACTLLNLYAPTGFQPLTRANMYAAFKDAYAVRQQVAALLSALEAG